jgi:inner membrane protein
MADVFPLRHCSVLLDILFQPPGSFFSQAFAFLTDLFPKGRVWLRSDRGRRIWMASAFAHAFVAVAMGKVTQDKPLSWRELFLGAFCSVVPDLDVIGFRFGIQYGDLWGHRGFTHSLLFAAVFAAALVALWSRTTTAAGRVQLFLYLFLCTASHGLLDAMTDGGLGVAFFSPFDVTRYFFPVRPVLVSPIGVSEFFSGYGVRVLMSEAVWICLPACAAFLLLRAVRQIWSATSAASSAQPR